MLKESYFSPDYLVSDEGYVLSKIKHTPLKYSINHKGYAIINVMVDGKQIGIAVHKVVAMAFCSGYKEGLQVNHIDGNKLNNRSENLEWVTPKENCMHATRILHKRVGVDNWNHQPVDMCDKNEKVIRRFDCYRDAARYLYPMASFERLRQIAQSISRVVTGYRKTYKGYIWKRVIKSVCM